ncbi:Gfo/Idh/MocA family protein [Pseudoponticoccus marisrubri]|uniref:Oxidoreductase n=1 Tax=Pseudoponticoccus marisrubri TaxID=1685382 RepID=A0A0W7WNN5_9RHOB|nr:Gfo/Idh/MocA family oxidoreductase [Pseudoponticoccus marisrubri]KUF12104.1 oxidoreductase [Pseudoponticoccus marisrubri]
MTPLPVCVIGGGAIGRRHVEVVTRCDRTRLSAVVESDPATRADLAASGLPVAAELDAVDPETRAAIIATPTAAHLPVAQACLARGWPIIVEKPLAGTPAEAEQLLTEAARLGLPLFTGHHRRCHPFTAAARDALPGIGMPVGIQGLWALRKHDSYYEAEWRRQPGHGPLMSNMSHEFDLMRFLLGEITEVSALTSSAQRGFVIEDSAALTLRFANGALGSFLITDAAASPWAFEAASAENPSIAGSGADYLRIVGTEGALAFPSLTIWGRAGPGEIEWSRPLARRAGPGFAPIDPLEAQVARFAAVVAGGTDPVLCTGADGCAALRLTLAAALSAQTGRPVRPEDVPDSYNGVTT